MIPTSTVGYWGLGRGGGDRHERGCLVDGHISVETNSCQIYRLCGGGLEVVVGFSLRMCELVWPKRGLLYRQGNYTICQPASLHVHTYKPHEMHA